MISQQNILPRFAFATIMMVSITNLPLAESFSIPCRPSSVASSKTVLDYAKTNHEFERLSELESSLVNGITFLPELKRRKVDGEAQLKRGSSKHSEGIDLHGLEQLAPLERHMLRMEGLEPYVLVSVLASTNSYGTINGINLFPNGHLDVISALLLGTGTISALSGIYATAIFSMSILYGKTALGLDKEEVYYRFMENTRTQRYRGYKAFSLSLLMFVIDILLIAVDKLPQHAQVGAVMIATATIAFAYTEFVTITKSASPLYKNITPRNKDENMDEN